MTAEPSRWQDNVKKKKYQLPRPRERVCICADPVRKISEVSKWVLGCGGEEWEEEAHPQVKAQFRFEGWVVIGERRNEESNNGCALLFRKEKGDAAWMDG